MRKLLAVTAVLVVLAMLCGCGGSSDDSESTQQPLTENTYNEKPTATNIAAFWFRVAGKAPFVEVATLSHGYWVNSTAVSFVTSAKGVRLLRAPKTEVYRLRVWYANRREPYRWDGEGLLPRTRTITSISGKSHERPLVRIKAYLYNERVQGAVPLRSPCSGCDNRPRQDRPPRSLI